MIYLVVILCMVIAFAIVFGILWQTGLMEGPARVEPPRIPNMRELPQGCLLALVLTGFVWFTLWGVVLVLALRFLRSPLG